MNEEYAMKSKLLLATALASLLASAGIAGAQGANEQGHKASGAGSAAQHAQSPSEHAQPGRMGQSERSPSDNRTMNNPSAQNERTKTQNPSAQNERNRTQNPSAQNERNRMQNPSAQNERNRTQNPSAQDERNRTQNPSAQNERNRTGAAENAQGTRENRGASAQLSNEQRTRIRTTVLGERNAPRLAQNDIGVNLSVGARIPRDRLHIRPLPLPETVVEVEPQWRGYDYFLVGDEIVVVEPGTFEIVAIIPA
jgi:hypothetical protein